MIGVCELPWLRCSLHLLRQVFLALVGKTAILPDIKEAMMHAGLIETTIKLMTVHHGEVCK